MNNLTKEYWSQFILKDSTGKFDGQQFESLVGELLRLHTNSEWTQTKKTRDGAKDFYRNQEGKLHWAECKAHSAHITLNLIGSTLVMATIENANQIIFFSYSKITSGTKNNLNLFATQTNKTIITIDDEILEKLILKYISDVAISKFFPEFIKDRNYKQITEVNDSEENLVSISCRLSKDPDIYDENIADEDIENNFMINIFSTFVLDIFLQNDSIFSPSEIEVNVDVSNLKNDERSLILLNNDITEKNIGYKHTLDPLHSLIWRFYLQPISRAKVFDLNIFNVEAGKKLLPLKLPKVQVVSIGTAAKLVGVLVNEFINIKLPAFIGNRKKTTFLNIYGESGTGKTRLLEEISDKFYGHGFKVYKFDGENTDNASFDHFIRVLYSKITSLPFDTEFMYEHDNLDENHKKEPLYRLIYNGSIDLNKDFDRFVDYVALQLLKNKISLIVDNVQHYDDVTVNFLIKLKEKCVGQAGLGNITLCFNKTFLIKGSKADILLNSILSQTSADFLSFEVLGFNENDVKNYIAQLLKFEGDKQNQKILDDFQYTIKLILDKASKISINDSDRIFYSPLYLVQMLLMLENKGIIFRNEDIGYHFKSPESLHDELRELPDNLEKLLDRKWEYMLSNYGEKQNLKDTVIILSFLINIEKGLFFKYFKDYKDELTQLEYTGIISIDDSQKIVFYHRKLYEFFNIKYDKDYYEYAKIITKFIEETNNKFGTLFYQYFIAMNMQSKVDKEILDHACSSLKSGTVYNESYLKFLPYLFNELFGFNKNDTRITLDNKITNLIAVCEQISSKRGFTEAFADYKQIYNDIEMSKIELKPYGKHVSDLLMSIANSYLPLYKDSEGLEVLEWGRNNIKDFDVHSEKAQDMASGQILNRLCVFYKSLNNPEQARNVGIEALNISKKHCDKFLELKCLIDLGNTYESKLINEENKQKLLFYWGKSIDIYELKKDNDSRIANSRPMVMLYNLQVLLINGKYEEYKKSYPEEIKYCDRNQNYFFMLKMQVLNIVAQLAFETEPDYESLLEEAIILKDKCLTYNANRSYWNAFFLLAKISFYYKQFDEMAEYYKIAFNTLYDAAQDRNIMAYNDDLIHEMIIDMKLTKKDKGINFDDFISKLPDIDSKKFRKLAEMNDTELDTYLNSVEASWSTFTKNNRNLPNP